MKKVIALSAVIFLLAGCLNTEVDPELAKIVKSGKTLGFEQAAIQIEEFSDFECSFCARAEKINKEILKMYPQQVKIIYKHFPIPSHLTAFDAALASECAREQGKFWEYSNLLFTNLNSHSNSELKKYSAELELNQEQFDVCLDDETYKNVVENEKREGTRRKITGTPTYFVGDQRVNGANKTAIIEAIEKILNNK